MRSDPSDLLYKPAIFVEGIGGYVGMRLFGEIRPEARSRGSPYPFQGVSVR